MKLSNLCLLAGFSLGSLGRLLASESDAAEDMGCCPPPVAADPTAAVPADKKPEWLAAYVKISSALAADDLAGAKAAASGLAGQAADSPPVVLQAGAITKASGLTDAREAFKTLTALIEPLAAGEKGYVVMYCPMKDADWVQAAGKVKNPYYGKAMLGCGEPKQVH
ncbi:MAG: DUF3347 domain-containing protein [Verrucomicrobia bacterium]|nr:DUF3347 domain-containing protein [Verrucomicrobiota bacterium]